MAERLSHPRDFQVEITLGRDQHAVVTLRILGGEALSTVAADTAVPAGLELAESEDRKDEPIMVVGSGQPLDYEKALAVHKHIRSIGLGAAQVPPLAPANN
jgi:hypothetical protein